MVIGVGASVVDVVVHTKERIVLRDKNPLAEQIFQVGGVVPTALMVLSRLGLPCLMHSAVGNDLFGQFILDQLHRESIGTEGIKTLAKEATSVSFAVVEPNGGERTGFTAHGIYSHLPKDAFPVSLPKDATLLLVDGHNIDIARQFLSLAKQRQVRSVMDVGTFKQGMDPLLRLVDVIIAPYGYGHQRWPKETLSGMLSQFLEFGAQTVIITMGDEGCMVATSKEQFHQPAYPVAAVDTNGAGDVFLGAFTYGMCMNWDVHHRVQFAAAVAALSCEYAHKDDKLLRKIADGFSQTEQRQRADGTVETVPVIPEHLQSLLRS